MEKKHVHKHSLPQKSLEMGKLRFFQSLALSPACIPSANSRRKKKKQKTNKQTSELQRKVEDR